MEGKTVPISVKIISVLYYLNSAGMITSAITLMVAGIPIPILGIIGLGGVLGSGMFNVGGIIMIVLGVFGLFVGWGLWKGKNWARIVAIIFMTIWTIMAIVSLIKGFTTINFLMLLIYAFIGGYLLFSKSVKEAFS